MSREIRLCVICFVVAVFAGSGIGWLVIRSIIPAKEAQVPPATNDWRVIRSPWTQINSNLYVNNRDFAIHVEARNPQASILIYWDSTNAALKEHLWKLATNGALLP